MIYTQGQGQGHSVQKLEWKHTDRRTEAIALPHGANAVGKNTRGPSSGYDSAR